MNTLEASIRQHTQAVNGQFPRPWMTDTPHPEQARVFIVGYNQATGFPTERIGSHDEYVDALFNRNGQSCRKLYERLRGDRGPSLTRTNIDTLRECLAGEGIVDVVETNVICYGTAMGRNLAHLQNPGGRSRGRELFREILTIIRPRVLIAHGAGTTKELGRVLSEKLPAVGVSYVPSVFVIPSLAPPKWNVWQKWALPHFAELSVQVRKSLEGH